MATSVRSYDWDLCETEAFLLATSRQSDVVSLSHHYSQPFPLCGGMWQLRLTVDSGSEAQDAAPRVGVHAILVEPHSRAAGPTFANFTLRLQVEHDPPAADGCHEYQHIGRSFGVGAGWGKLDLTTLADLAAARRVQVCMCAVTSMCAVRDEPSATGKPRPPQDAVGLGYATDAEALAAAVHGLDQLADRLDSFVEGEIVLGAQPFQLRTYASGASEKELESVSCVGFSLSSQAAVPLAVTFRLRVFTQHSDTFGEESTAFDEQLVSYHCVQRLEFSDSWWCDKWISRDSLTPFPESLKLQFDQISIMTLEHMYRPLPTTPRLNAQEVVRAEADRDSCGVVAHVMGLHGFMGALSETKESLSTGSFILANSSWSLSIQQIDGVGLTADSVHEAHVSRGAIAVDLVHEGFESVAVSAEVTITVAGQLLYHGMPAAQLHSRSDDRCLRITLPARLLAITESGQALPEHADDTDQSGQGDLRIEVANVQQSELVAGSETPRAAGLGRSTTFVWSMRNFVHLATLATRLDGWYVESSHFNMRGRDWSVRVYPNGDEMVAGSAGKLVTRVVLESSAWTWAAFVVELTDEHGNPFTPDGASPRQVRYLKMSQFTNVVRDLACVFSNEMIWNECVRVLIKDMVVVGMETKEDEIIWTIDGFASLPLTTSEDVSFTFHHGGCKWRLAIFYTRDTGDLGVSMRCLSDSAVVASFTLSFGTDLAGEIGRQRVADHDFARRPSVYVGFKRKAVLAGSPGVAHLKLAAMCCSWAAVSTALEARMTEIPEQDSKLTLRHLNDSPLQERRPSGSALLNVTLCAERRPFKVRWIVAVRDAGRGVGVGVAVRGAVNLDGDDMLHREIVPRIKRDVSLGDVSGATEAETEIDRRLRQACANECMEVQCEEFELAEGRQALVRVLTVLQRDGLTELGAHAFNNISTMVREALVRAAAANDWKDAADLLQLASHYRSETSEHVYCALIDLPVVQDSDFWDHVYLARCDHERQKAELQVSTSEDKRLVTENTFLAQALILLATMQDMKVAGSQRHAFVQCMVDSGMIAGHSANVWFADFVDNEPIISPATDGGLMPDEDSGDAGRRTFGGLPSDTNVCCAVLECPDQPEAGVPMDPALWNCTIPPAGTGGVAVVGSGDKLCLEWVHAPEHGCGFLKIQNHSRENSWAYTREVRTDTTREQRWRPAIWLDGGAQVEVRGTSFWTRRSQPPDRPKAPVCGAVPGAVDAVCLAWEHDPQSGDAPVTEYIIQSRKRRRNGGGWIADWQLHSRHVPMHNSNGSHEFKLTPLIPDGGRWTFRVVARSLGGQSEPSDPCRLWTTPALPAIRNFCLLWASATEAEVCFDPISWPCEGFEDEQQRRLRIRQREEPCDQTTPALAPHAFATTLQAKQVLPVEHGVFSTAQYFRVRHVSSVWRDFAVHPGEEPVGQLAPEDVVEVLQTRTTSSGYVRLRIKILGSRSGWVDSADVTTGAALLRRMGTDEVESWERQEASHEVALATPAPSEGPTLSTPNTQVAASQARTSLTTSTVDEVTSSAAATTHQCYYVTPEHQAVTRLRIGSSTSQERVWPGRAESAPESGVAATSLLAEAFCDGMSVQSSDIDGSTIATDRVVPAVTYPEVLKAESHTCRILNLRPGTRYTLMLEASLDGGRTISMLEVTTNDTRNVWNQLRANELLSIIDFDENLCAPPVRALGRKTSASDQPGIQFC